MDFPPTSRILLTEHPYDLIQLRSLSATLPDAEEKPAALPVSEEKPATSLPVSEEKQRRDIRPRKATRLTKIIANLDREGQDWITRSEIIGNLDREGCDGIRRTEMIGNLDREGRDFIRRTEIIANLDREGRDWIRGSEVIANLERESQDFINRTEIIANFDREGRDWIRRQNKREKFREVNLIYSRDNSINHIILIVRLTVMWRRELQMRRKKFYNSHSGLPDTVTSIRKRR